MSRITALLLLLFIQHISFSQFLLEGYNLAPTFDKTVDLCIADFNQNQFPDIFFLNQSQPCELHLNTGGDLDGDGMINFIEQPNLNLPDLYHLSVVSLHANLDNFPDIFLGRGRAHNPNQDEPNQLWVNDATGAMINASTNLPVDHYHTEDVILTDIDGDGKMDLVLANGWVGRKAPNPNTIKAEANTIYWNRGDTDGDGIDNFVDMHFRLDSWTSQAPSLQVTVADINGDSLMDIFFANYEAQNELYLNEGIQVGDSFPTFSNALASFIPDELGRADLNRAASLEDLDGDLDMDLVVGRDFEKPHLYLNDGVGGFSPANSMIPAGLGATLNYTWDLILADFTDDQQVDIFLCGDQNVLLVNQGQGAAFLLDSLLLPKGIFSSLGAGFQDLNQDGYEDLVLADLFEQNRLQIADSVGIFADVTQSLIPPDADLSRFVCFGNLNEDTLKEILVLNDYEHSAIYRANFDGTFSNQPLPADFQSFRQFHTAEIIDLDQDYRNEIVYTVLEDNSVLGSEAVSILWNNGGFQFQRTDISLPLFSFISDLVIADFTGDQIPDILVCRHSKCIFNGAKPLFFVNLGNGQFSADSADWKLPAINWRCDYSGAAVDIDLDGDQDLVFRGIDHFLGSMDIDRVYINDGQGNFTDETSNLFSSFPQSSTTAMAIADFNKDQYPDIFLANSPGNTAFWTAEGQNRLFLNDQGLSFQEIPLPKDSFHVRDVLTMDADLDGDQDVVVLNWAGPDFLPNYDRIEDRPFMYLNQGDSSFLINEYFFPIVSQTGEDAFSMDQSDVDQDGYPDLFVGTDGQNRLYINNHGLPIGLEEAADLNVKVYPNPGFGEFWIETTGLTGIPELTVFDFLGRTRLHQTLLVQKKQPLNLNHLVSGLYFLRIEDKAQSTCIKLIKH